MGGTTPKALLPYPTGTDRVADGDNAIQALATALDSTAYATSAPVTAGPNVVAGAGGAFRRGLMVVLALEGWTTSAALVPAATLCTLPVGFRPTSPFRFLFINGNNSTFGFGVVNPTGAVLTATAIASGAAIYGEAVFPID